MSRLVIPALCLAALTTVGAARGEVYKWVDDQGRIHFSDEKPVREQAETVDIEVTSYSFPTVKANPLSKRSSDGSSTGERPTVIMYSTTWCGFCKKARRYFRANDIPFREYDVEKSSKGKRDYEKLGGRGVPIILVGDKRLNGFSVERFRRIYNDA